MTNDSNRHLNPFTDAVLQGMRQRLVAAYIREHRVSPAEAVKRLMDDLMDDVTPIGVSDASE